MQICSAEKAKFGLPGAAYSASQKLNLAACSIAEAWRKAITMRKSDIEDSRIAAGIQRAKSHVECQAGGRSSPRQLAVAQGWSRSEVLLQFCTLFRLPKPKVAIASDFHLGSSGSNFMSPALRHPSVAVTMTCCPLNFSPAAARHNVNACDHMHMSGAPVWCSCQAPSDMLPTKPWLVHISCNVAVTM